MPIDYAKAGATTPAEKAKLDQIWIDFCGVFKWNQMDFDLKLDRTGVIHRQWQIYATTRLNDFRKSSSAKTASYWWNEADKFSRLADEAIKNAKAAENLERQRHYERFRDSYQKQQHQQERPRADIPNTARARAVQILGLGPNPTKEQIKAAFRAKAKQTHPDAGGSAKAFNEVQKAYELLVG